MEGPITREYGEKKRSSYEPKVKEKELASFVREQYELAESAKQGVIEEAWLGTAFYTGKQWTRWNRVTQMLEEPSPPAWRVRMTLNYILPTVETLVGKLTENRPGFMVMPATDDDDDKDRARASEKLLNYIWHETNMQVKVHEFSKWMATTGTAFFRVWWDPTAGVEYEFEEEEPIVEHLEGVVGETAEEMEAGDKPPAKKKRKTEKTGFPVVDVLSVLDVAWDPGAKDMETARWIVHANSLHIDQIKDNWPKGKYVTEKDSYSANTQSAQIIKEFSGNEGLDEKYTDRVIVLEYFERPSPRHPDGRYIVVAGDIVLEQSDELPYGMMPFVMARHITAPGKFAGEGVVKSIVAPQKELNKSVSQRIENKNLHASPKWLAEKGSIEKHQITDQPGEVIVYSRTASRPPQPLPPPPLSPEHRAIQDEQIGHIEAISGVSDVTRGMASASTSGRAIGLLSDLDQTKLGPTVREMERAIEDLCSCLLRFWRDYMPIPMTIRAVGKNKAIDVFDFYSSDIQSTDVRIVANSMLPKHPSYRREQVMQAFQVGLLGDPADPQTKLTARKLMEFGDTELLEGDDSRDRNYAKEEVELIKNGGWSDVQAWEDHLTHIDVHMAFMKSVEYRILPTEVQENFVRHLAWHYYMESQNAQGVPWWTSYVEAGGKDMPPPEMPAGMVGDELGVDMAQGQGAIMAPGTESMPMAPPGAEGMGEGGLIGGGTPELNQAIGTRGPGVADYEFGFEA
tara:strand:+ start:6795 stop:9011 length:2217 start_codon:yes stop_codon:yes gene_type:complete